MEEITVYKQPSNKFFEIISSINTPCILYDEDMIIHTLKNIKDLISIVDEFKLHIAIKSTHNVEILKLINQYVEGCDVASIGELKLAKEAGFQNITTTSPGYSKDEFNELIKNNVIPDIDSLEQLKYYAKNYPSTDVGLRIKVLLDDKYQNEFTFMNDSRFGIVNIESAKSIVDENNLKIKSLHIHTGQSNPKDFLEKFKYLIDIATDVKSVNTINLGGGLFHFFSDIKGAKEVLNDIAIMLDKWQLKNNREIKIIIEPGALLLGGNGFLISSIMNMSEYKNQKNIILDVSPWNISPWIKPKVFMIDHYEDNYDTPYYISGNSLYENDFLTFDKGNPETYYLPNSIEIENRLLFAGMGAYTTTNKRYFNKLRDTELFILKSSGELVKI